MRDEILKLGTFNIGVGTTECYVQQPNGALFVIAQITWSSSTGTFKLSVRKELEKGQDSDWVVLGLYSGLSAAYDALRDWMRGQLTFGPSNSDDDSQVYSLYMTKGQQKARLGAIRKNRDRWIVRMVDPSVKDLHKVLWNHNTIADCEDLDRALQYATKYFFDHLLEYLGREDIIKSLGDSVDSLRGIGSLSLDYQIIMVDNGVWLIRTALSGDLVGRVRKQLECGVWDAQELVGWESTECGNDPKFETRRVMPSFHGAVQKLVDAYNEKNTKAGACPTSRAYPDRFLRLSADKYNRMLQLTRELERILEEVRP